MIASREDGEVGSLASAGVVVWEISQLEVLGRHRHDGEVILVTDGLEVASDDDKVNSIPLAFRA